jgi:hypothetical protein
MAEGTGYNQKSESPRRTIMKITSVVATLAMAATVSMPVFAAKNVHTVNGTSNKHNNVHITLANDTQQAISIKAGDQELKLEPGKNIAVALATGDKVIAEDAGPTHPAGEVLIVASSAVDQATVHVK